MSPNNHHHDHNELLKIAPYYSVATAIIISIIKYYGLLTTDSASLFASLMDSFLDLSTSIINFVALRMALMPPDHNHRFGHNKIEDLAVFAQSVGFFLFGIFSFYNSINHFIHPVALNNVSTAIYVMIISSILNLMLITYQSYIVKKTKSSIIEADRLHYFSDLLTNMVVIFSLYFSSRFIVLDALFGILIACYIVYSSYGLFVRATKNLVDEELNDGERGKILDIIGKHKEVLGVHELKTRYAGSKPFIQFHLEMDGNSNLFEAHMLSDRIMEDILKAFPEAEVIIHQDPAGVEENVLYREKL
jgi:ferrous-iron efflux pump FieF